MAAGGLCLRGIMAPYLMRYLMPYRMPRGAKLARKPPGGQGGQPRQTGQARRRNAKDDGRKHAAAMRDVQPWQADNMAVRKD